MINVTQRKALGQTSERERERESERQKSWNKRDIVSRVGAARKRQKESEESGERERCKGWGTERSVRCKSKQEVNKANALGTPTPLSRAVSLSLLLTRLLSQKGRSESAARRGN